MSKEEIYDKEIAPLLLEAVNKCKEHDIPFVATVFYDWSEKIENYSWGSTYYIPKDCNSSHVLTSWVATRANGNADSLINWMLKHGKKYGHTSAWLTVLENK